MMRICNVNANANATEIRNTNRYDIIMNVDMDINEYVDRRLIQGLQIKCHTFWGRGPTRASVVGLFLAIFWLDIFAFYRLAFEGELS